MKSNSKNVSIEGNSKLPLVSLALKMLMSQVMRSITAVTLIIALLYECPISTLFLKSYQKLL